MKKILFISHDASRTGAPLYLLRLTKWLRENSDLSFEILLKDGGPLFGEFKQIAPTRWINWGVITESNPTIFQRIQRKIMPQPVSTQLRRLYPLDEYPLVYSNTIANGELVREFATAGHKVICHAHEMRMGFHRWGGNSLPEAAKLTNVFIAVSLAVKRDLCETLELPPEKIELIHGCGPPHTMTELQYRETRQKFRLQLGLSEDEIAVGMCGTIDWRKGADLFPPLVSAVKKLQGDKRRYRFFWIGAEPKALEYLQLKNDIRLLGVGDMASLINSVPNPQDYFTALDVFALLSREDPFPLVMLETAALAIPLVCFEGSGGAEELIADGAGLAVPYLDLAQFAQALVKLGGDKPLRQEMGRKARAKTFSQFTLEIQGPKLLAVIRRYLDQTTYAKTSFAGFSVLRSKWTRP